VQKNADISEQLRKNQIFGEESEDERIKIRDKEIRDDSSSEKQILLPKQQV
jgi:hypothetical protein